MSKVGLLVLGSVNTDLAVRVAQLPAAGETVLGEDAVQRPGGKGGNQAVAAAVAGADVSIAGRVGDDERARALRRSLEAAGVHTEELRTADGRSSGLAVVLLAEDGENSIVVSPGANYALVPGDVDLLRERIERARLLLMQLEVPLPVVARACEVAAQVGTPVVLNLAPATRAAAGLLGSVEVLVVNRAEAEVLLDRAVADLDAVREAAQELLHAGPRAVVVTAGVEGAVLADPDGTTHLPATPVTAVDTTGAGDAFVGVMAARLSQGRALRAALEDASVAAAAAVRVDGAQLTALPAALHGDRTERTS